MKYYKILVTVIALAFTWCARAEISPEKRAEINRLLELTGLEKLMEQMKGQMLTSMKASSPNVPAELWDRLSTKMNVREVLEKIMPIYDKYYTLEDLRAVNTFYSSAAGQKVLSTLPQVMQESMAVGQEWGQKAGQQLAAEITAESAAKKQ